jgi:protease PrsW
MEIIILNIFYILLLIVLLRKLIIKLKKTSINEIVKSNEFYLFLLLSAIGIAPIFVFNNGHFVEASKNSESTDLQYGLSIFMAFLISAVWLMYVRKIDIYEKERWKHVIVTFVLGSIFSEFAPLGYSFVGELGIILNGQPINDFLYSVFVIGGIEEMVKIIPFLILLKFSKAADEPYDYILYPSIAALGFAFVENIYYIFDSGLTNIGGRALYSTVAHMVFSSVVGYGMLLYKFRYTKLSRIGAFLLFFLAAATMHGFYDFWLINEIVSDYSFLTTIYFLISIHIWFVLKNNAANVSNYYDPKISLDNDSLKWYLVISLSSIFMIGYIIVTSLYGVSVGNGYLISSWLAYGYLLLYLTLSFSRYKISHGRLSKIKIPKFFFIPKPIKKE